MLYMLIKITCSFWLTFWRLCNMRLSNFVIDTCNLNEGIDVSKHLKKIRNECSEILNIYQYTFPNGLYRASDSRFIFKSRTPREDRDPRDTKPEVHEVLDKVFNEIFGWKVRSEGVFTSPSFPYADIFGDYKYYIFPTNGFKYVYNKTGNENIYDFIRNVFYTEGVTNETTDVLRRIIEREYTDKSLERVIQQSSGVEVIIKCNKYYALYVDQDNSQALTYFLEKM